MRKVTISVQVDAEKLRAIQFYVGKKDSSLEAELDDCISRYSVGWAFARIPRMAAAVMRTAMYEVLYMPDIPNAAAINEAVEIAKKYEPVEVVSFVNGILGTFVRTEFEDTPPKPEKTADPSKQEEA